MGRKCEVAFCSSALGRSKSKSFYGLPRDSEVCSKWVKFCSNEELEKAFQDGGVEAIRCRKICADHFGESDFVNPRKTSQGIRAFALPAEYRDAGIDNELGADDMILRCTFSPGQREAQEVGFTLLPNEIETFMYEELSIEGGRSPKRDGTAMNSKPTMWFFSTHFRPAKGGPKMSVTSTNTRFHTTRSRLASSKSCPSRAVVVLRALAITKRLKRCGTHRLARGLGWRYIIGITKRYPARAVLALRTLEITKLLKSWLKRSMNRTSTTRPMTKDYRHTGAPCWTGSFPMRCRIKITRSLTKVVFALRAFMISKQMTRYAAR